MGENPYQSPRSEGEPEDRGFERLPLREVVRGWERLRPAYNGILLLPVLGLAGWWLVAGRMPPERVLRVTLGILIVANVGFLFGSAVELGLRAWFREAQPPGVGRTLIFSAGLVTSAGIVVLIFLLAGS